MESRPDVLEALKPSRVVNFLVGNTSFKVHKSKSGRISIEYYKSAALLWKLVDITLVIAAIFIQYNARFSADILDSSNAINKFVNVAYFSFIAGFLLMMAILNKARAKEIIQFYKEVVRIEKTMKDDLEIEVDFTKARNRSITFILVGTVSYTLYTYRVIHAEGPRRIYSQLSGSSTYVSVLNYIGLSCFFHAGLRVIESILDGLNRGILLKRDVRNPSDELDLIKVKGIFKLFQDICNLVRLLIGIFSTQFLISFATIFVICTLKVYGVLCIVKIDGFYKWTYILNTAFYFSNAFGEKFIIMYVSYKCMLKVNQTKRALFKLLLKIPHHQSKLQTFNKEIHTFALFLLHDDLKIMAANFFPIDLAVFMTACGTVLTYVTILIQNYSGNQFEEIRYYITENNQMK